MFKRYKSPYESERSTTVYETEQPGVPSSVRRLSIAQEERSFKGKPLQEPPPRIFEGIQTKPSPSPYRTEQEKRIDLSQQEGNFSEKQTWNDPNAPKNLPSQPLALPHNEAPEAILGETVSFQGRLHFQRLLRIDGRFEGELQSNEGKLIVGPKGVIKSNLILKEAVIEGHVEGNITVSDRIEIRGYARVVGNIEARAISVDEGAVIQGQVSIVTGDESSRHTG